MIKKTFFLDSITDADQTHQGRIGISGSHGGLYPAALASAAGIRAVLFYDAGIGLDQAGVAGVLALANVGMAAAAIDCHSARIGSARDAYDHGIISVVNSAAAALGVLSGMPVRTALLALEAAEMPIGTLPPVQESRHELTLEEGGQRLLLVDSASLVTADDANRIIITGSHGGLIGGDPARALKTVARIAVFNDAGMAENQAGTTRLPALDAQGVVAVTVSHETARIGDARSSFETGIISKANDLASQRGADVGTYLKDWIAKLEIPAS
ncbi:hypothetical protein [Sneathiella sp.]|uniref:hypothetical protein n=1 Tax=Sneathiella sp. TaxID=1964365 RepID=UPI0035643DE1